MGKELVKCTSALPVDGGRFGQPAASPFGPQADRIQAGGHAARIPVLLEKWTEFETEEALDTYLAERNLKIPVWTAADLGADEDKLGLAGSPTQVYKVNFVVLETTESKEVPANSEGIAALMQELVKEYIVG